ncbi:MAG: extracellular solute-binding protein [Burkholderiales bacterium]|jgi:ABC-type Fe3+ transport system substrate-binding protein|nr:extracellular solute-binding protein [Burkholderiales bacterium]
MPQAIRRLAAAIVAAAAVVAAPLALGQQVTVVTSFPKELTDAYKKAFEAKNPGAKVEILNKNTVAGVAYVRELAPGSRPDVFWASAPDAFEVLANDKLLEKYDPGVAGIPAKIGSYPVNDPEGFYRGQALAGYGIMWNTRYLKANKLPEPREWSDLVRPVYFGHVATSSPSRSGTTHLTVETILQGEGWEKGWAQLLQIGGNSAAITERSFAVPDGVSNGQYGLGLVIDFFGLAAKASGFPVEFVYPSVTAIVPANIALIAGAKNPDLGKRFIAFTLSEEGQLVLLDPKVMRLPVLPKTYEKAPKGFPNPYAGTIKPKVNFDSTLSEERYYLVSSLFDQTITFRHKELVAATRAINDAAAKLALRPNAQGEKLLAEARAVAYTPVVDESKMRDKGFLAAFRTTKKDAETAKRVTALEEHWSTEARKNYARAVELANQAAATVK